MQNSRQASRPSGWSGIDARRNKFVFLQFLRCRSGEEELTSVARCRGQYFALWIFLKLLINFFIYMIGNNQMQKNQHIEKNQQMTEVTYLRPLC